MTATPWTRRKLLCAGAGIALASLTAVAIPLAGKAQNEPKKKLPGGLGCVPSPEKTVRAITYVKLAAAAPPADRPAQYIVSDLPPVASQGQTGSCVGWSTAYYCYSSSVARQMNLSEEKRKDPKYLFSPSFIWHQHNGGEAGRGMHITDAFKILSTQGCATFAEMPWDEKDVTSQPNEAAKTRALKWRARKTVVLFKGAMAGDPADPEKLRTWLWEYQRPIVLAIPVYEDFGSVSNSPDFVYEHTSRGGRMLGYHAICIIGYDTTKNAFRMINSWGPQWGNHGQLWLSEEFVTKETFEGCGQITGGPVGRGKDGEREAVLPGAPHSSLSLVEPTTK